MSTGQHVFHEWWQMWLTIIFKSSEDMLRACLTVKHPGQVRKPVVSEPAMKVTCSTCWARYTVYHCTWAKVVKLRFLKITAKKIKIKTAAEFHPTLNQASTLFSPKDMNNMHILILYASDACYHQVKSQTLLVLHCTVSIIFQICFWLF